MKKIALSVAILFLVCFYGLAQQKIYVNVSGMQEQIYSVNLATCSSQSIGPAGTLFYDIAFIFFIVGR